MVRRRAVLHRPAGLRRVDPAFSMIAKGSLLPGVL